MKPFRSQKELQARGTAYERLEVLIGKWITVGKTEPMNEEPPLDITASDPIRMAAGQILDPAHSLRPLGKMNVGGVEMIGYDGETGKYVSHFYDSRGNV